MYRRGESRPVHPFALLPAHGLHIPLHSPSTLSSQGLCTGCPVFLDSPFPTFSTSPFPSQLLSSRALGYSLDGLPEHPSEAPEGTLFFLSGCHSIFFRLVAGCPECWPCVSLCSPSAQRHAWQFASPLSTWW